jgi:transposase
LKPAGEEGPTAGGAEDLPERWSAQRKMELVLRLLRGEPLDAVSRESQVPAHELEGWKRVFLEAGGRGLKSRSDPEERELTLARAKVGELTMRLETPPSAAGRIVGNVADQPGPLGLAETPVGGEACPAYPRLQPQVP